MPERVSGRPRLSLLGSMGWFVVSYGLAILGYLASNAIASRWLGRELFGYFVIVVTTSAVLGQLGLLGVHRAGLREAARMDSEQDDDDVLGVLRRGARAVLLVPLPLAGAVGGAAMFAFARGQSPIDRWTLAVGFAFMVVLGGQQKLWANLLRGLGETRAASLLEGRSGGAVVAVLQTLLLLTTWRLMPSTGLPGAVVALGIGFAIPVGWAAWRVRRRWRHVAAHASLGRDLGLVFRRDWRFALNQLASYLNATVEIWIAGAFLLATATSLFSAGQRLALLVIIPLTSVQVVFAPVCARLIARGEFDRLQTLLRSGATLAAATTAVLWLPMIVLPGDLLALVFGSEFRGAATVLMLLTVGSLANVASGMCGTALTMSRYEGDVAAVQAITVVIRVLAGIAAAVLFGLTGLAVTAAVMTVSTYATLWWLARRRLGLRTEPTLRPSLKAMRQTRG
jgi:O-antigen/teichoic acid export membrane protein